MEAVWRRPRRGSRVGWPALLACGLLCLPTAATAESAESSSTAGPTVEEIGPPEEAIEARPECNDPGSDGNAFLDSMQRGVYYSVCNSARWFDGLFGTRRYDQDSDETFGRLGLYELWDDRDDFRTRMRLRARLALPTMQDRLRLIFGRVDENEVVEDSRTDTGGSMPTSFQRVEDEAWLLGLGYSKQGGLENGFDFGAGIRVRTPVDPYSKGSYRHNFIFTDATALRVRETLFWRDSRGFGETTEIDLDHLLTPRLLFRWDNTATLAEDVGEVEWTSALILFQSLSERRAVAYTSFISGVEDTDVPIRNYGVELRYRQRVLREWLFLEARTSLTWPRETLAEEREINPGIGIGFEMYFGPVPEMQMR